MQRNLIVICFFLICGLAPAQEITLEQVLDQYYKATGMDNLLKVNTMILTGTTTSNDVMPVKIIRMRPDRFFMEFDVADMTAYQVYDGDSAWWTMPWTGNPKPQTMTGDRFTDIRNRADFDGLLYNWQAKGHKAELTETDTVDQSPCWKIKLTRADGGVEYYSIDKQTYLLVKRQYTRIIRGRETILEGYASDFRDIGGIRIPFTQKNFLAGQLYNTTQFETVDLNKPVDVKIFAKPD